jgi:predicted ribosome quality control (RQC) complex YloA/Tae2 family protein
MGSKGRPYRTVDVDGWEVLVGRGADDNDYLTFRVADKRDHWLHVGGGTPGSHVVVRNPDGEVIPRDVLEKAAQLAAWYSKARGASKVEVHACRVSDVKKARGAPRGEVQISKFKKLRVVPSRLDVPDDDG